MQNINFIEATIERGKSLNNLESILGKGLMMPFNATNSGSRKLMYSTMIEHKLGLMHPETPLLQTGHEQLFGEFSSSIIKAEDDFTVIGKVYDKTENKYYLIVLEEKTQIYKVIQRIEYEHITETYGFLYNNEYIDGLDIGCKVKKGETLIKSTSFDEYENRQDGTNILSTYLSNEDTKEDSISISEETSKQLSVPIIKYVRVVINDNDIPLNLYGDDSYYKSFPDIGEEIKDGIICALRREKIEQCLFAQSSKRLKNIMMSDDKFTSHGKVIDIKISCNNPELLNEYHFSQLKYYYNLNKDFVTDFVELVKPIIESGATCSYDLQKLYYNCTKEVENVQYLNDKPFSNTIIDFVILESLPAMVGDKICNRYGGKGVISKIIPNDEMPRLKGSDIPIGLIWNSSTCVNRENVGQLFEGELNHISHCIIEYMNMKVLHFEEALEMYLKFITLVDEEQGNAYRQYLNQLNIDEQMAFYETVCQDKGIQLSVKPISTLMSIDKLDLIYKEFPFVKQLEVLMPQEDSNGNLRFIDARRKLSCGHQYIYRLKQYAEEKCSYVSLSSTNMRNENSRNSSKKNYKTPHSRTPVRFGEMETGNLIHLGVENVIVNLMLHSASPTGRRLAKELLTDDPFKRNIVLDADSKNRSVEILNAYLATMGLRIKITKRPKVYTNPIQRCVIRREPNNLQVPIHRINKNEVFNYNEYMNRVQNQQDYTIMRDPIRRTKENIATLEDSNNNTYSVILEERGKE